MTPAGERQPPAVEGAGADPDALLTRRARDSVRETHQRVTVSLVEGGQRVGGAFTRTPNYITLVNRLGHA